MGGGDQKAELQASGWSEKRDGRDWSKTRNWKPSRKRGERREGEEHEAEVQAVGRSEEGGEMQGSKNLKRNNGIKERGGRKWSRNRSGTLSVAGGIRRLIRNCALHC